MPKATLIDPSGKKVVVETGSADAQNYFGQGYKLMGADGYPVGSLHGTPVKPYEGRVIEHPGGGTAPGLPGPNNGTPVPPRYPNLDSILATNNDPRANLDTSFTDQDAETIRQQFLKQAQMQIDSINSIYDQMARKEEFAGMDRSGQTRALASRGAGLDNPRGLAQVNNTTDFNAASMRALEADRQAKLATVYDAANTRADTAITNEKARTDKNAEDYLAFLHEQRDQAKSDLTTLAGSGTALKDIPSDLYSKLLKQTGYDSLVFDTIYNASLPKPQQIDYKIENLGDGKVLFYGQDPKTGELVQKKYDYSLGAGEKLQILDGIPYATSTDADGHITLKPIQGYQERPDVKGTKNEGFYYITYENGKPKINYLTNGVTAGGGGTKSKIVDYVSAWQEVMDTPTLSQSQIDAAGGAVNGLTEDARKRLLENISAQAGDGLNSTDYKTFLDIMKSKNVERTYNYKVTEKGVVDVDNNRLLTPEEQANYFQNVAQSKITF